MSTLYKAKCLSQKGTTATLELTLEHPDAPGVFPESPLLAIQLLDDHREGKRLTEAQYRALAAERITSFKRLSTKRWTPGAPAPTSGGRPSAIYELTVTDAAHLAVLKKGLTWDTAAYGDAPPAPKLSVGTGTRPPTPKAKGTKQSLPAPAKKLKAAGAYEVIFSADGAQLWSVGYPEAIEWSTAKWAEGERLKAKYKAAAAPPGWLGLQPQSEKSLTLLRRPASGKPVVLKGHTSFITATACTPDGKLIATSGGSEKGGPKDATVRVWEVESGKALAVLAHKAAVEGVAISADGARVWSSDDACVLRAWDVAKKKVLWEVQAYDDEYGSALKLAHHGGALFTAGQTQSVREWDAATGKQRSELDPAAQGWAPVSDTSGHFATPAVSERHIAAVRSEHHQPGSPSTLLVWSRESGKLVGAHPPKKTHFSSVAIDPAGRWLAVGMGDAGVWVWDLAKL